MQFVSEFIVQSVEYLEHIANPEAPPLALAAIERVKNEFDAPDKDMDALRTRLQGMEDAFHKQGNLSSWSPDLLDEINACFLKNYVEEDGRPVPCLFFPDSPDNLNLYASYCSGVDHALRKHSFSAPRYAREYFAYYSIWKMRGFPFPVPLRTKSVVGILNDMAKKLTKGFCEVSRENVVRFPSTPSGIVGWEHTMCPAGSFFMYTHLAYSCPFSFSAVPRIPIHADCPVQGYILDRHLAVLDASP